MLVAAEVTCHVPVRRLRVVGEALASLTSCIKTGRDGLLLDPAALPGRTDDRPHRGDAAATAWRCLAARFARNWVVKPKSRP
jgi:hypothetical protein